MTPNQVGGPGEEPAEGAPGDPPGDPLAPPVEAARPPIRRGLLLWLLVAGGGGVASVAAGRLEGAGLLAIAGLFALAQATDAAALPAAPWPAPAGLPPAVAVVRALVRAIVPLGGALFYASIAAFARGGGADAGHRLAAAWSAGAALACLALALPAVERTAARALFRDGAGPPGRTRCLAAQVAVVLLLLPVPGRLLFPDLIAVARASGTALADPGALSVQLGGEVAFALAGVGLWVRRDARAASARLGLGPMRTAEWGLAALGVLAAIALNSGMEAAEHAWLPRLWRADAETTRLIAAQLPVAVSLLLGTSAGVGEELVVRGALQPRAGVLAAALLFACGHVQYTWFGMLTIALLGVLLGVIRRRAGTTTAIVVHATYDVFAALTSS